MMTRFNVLGLASSVTALLALSAFTFSEQRSRALEVLLPDETRPSATTRPPAGQTRDLTTFKKLSNLNPAPRDTGEPVLKERYDDFSQPNKNPVDLNDPTAIEKNVDYDPVSDRYILTEKIGDDFFRAPTYMTFEEYVRYRDQKQQDEYFDKLNGVVEGGRKKKGADLLDPVTKFNINTSLIDRLFGGTKVDIKPQGNINLTFGYNWQNIQNPILTANQQSLGRFDFDMDINVGARGKIGEKLNLDFNYNTKATFDFDNQMKLNYDAKSFGEDEILQDIQAGNVSLPLRSTLIKGAQNLFGLKAELKFGHLRLTTLLSQQRSKHNNLTVQGGAQVQKFQVPIDEYDENRHFFLSQYNREQFETSLRCLPVPLSLFRITKMQVWITNDRLETTNKRDIVALADLGEPAPHDPGTSPTPGADVDISQVPLPYNGANDLYSRILTELKTDNSLRNSDKVVQRLQANFGLKQIRDFEKQSCRLLQPTEYSYHDQLGFVSINLNVQPDQMVGFACEYTYNGKAYKIGELSSDLPPGDTLHQTVLFTKMLKSTTANVTLPIWDLMMKNVYAIGTANLDPQEFRFDIYYEDPGKGQIRFLNNANIPQALNSKPLLQVFRLDDLNAQNDPGADGVFDFVPGLTINLRSGRVMFPVLEPFGSYLSKKLKDAGTDSATISTLVYPQLYDSTIFRAREYQHLNRFTLKGSYKSSVTADISLGTFNLPQGSVRVSGGGRNMVEGVDYEVDYNIGKVRILNDAILQSGQAVNVSFEDNTLFGFNSRTMLGLRADYDLNKDVKLGATYMNLFERPLTQKVNVGDDPINNKMYGADFSISKDAPWLTKLVDKLPFFSTKEPSSIQVQAEAALLDPGHASAIDQGSDAGGIVYLDDFEGSTSGIPLTTQSNQWVISSTPSIDTATSNHPISWLRYPESELLDTTLSGVNRARLSWYVADPSGRDGIDAMNPYTRPIQYQDLFPNKQLTPLEQSNLRPLDITIYPNERGPYNFELPKGHAMPTTGLPISAGMVNDGFLKDPGHRWAGIMRGLNTNDFEAANVEFVEFWMLNPYMDKKDPNSPTSDAGSMYIDLGSINEDVMRDSRQFFENALPTTATNSGTVKTSFGRVPVLQPVVTAFDNDPAKRALQDVGLDGLNDSLENVYFDNYVNTIANSPDLGKAAKDSILADPSNDNFVYYRDPIFNNQNQGLLSRYRKFNNPQGNSPVNNTTNLNPSSTNYPDGEDLNRDNSLNETEAFFRYRIPLPKSPSGDSLDIMGNDTLAELITDRKTFVKDGDTYTWYRFKVPLIGGKNRLSVGGISDFRSVRFIRTVFTGFTERTTFRFATFQLGRNQWRRYQQLVRDAVRPKCQVDQTQPAPGTSFDVNKVSIEENASRQPFNYTIPYGVQREQSVGAFPDILQNEQSLSMTVCPLKQCDDRAIYKTLNMDLRQFKRIKMYTHLEDKDPLQPVKAGQLAVFIRLGSDFYRNYYEYVVPLTPSDPTVVMGQSSDSRLYKEEVWRPENNVEFPLDLLVDLKKRRNADHPNLTAFSEQDPDNPSHQVTVVGNPNLGYVKGVMIGVRNIDTTTNDAYCGEVWVNELRLQGFNEQGGYAGLARVDLKLADLGNVSFATNYQSIGWGSIEQKVNQRAREEVIQFDFSTNLELGKFLPKEVGLRLPFYYQYTNITKNPEYDPYDLDIKLADKLNAQADPTKRDSIRQTAQDVTVTEGYNFTNVRLERGGGKGGGGKTMPWDISNFSFTYAHNVQTKRTPFIVLDEQKQDKGGFDYTYSPGLKHIYPFKSLVKSKLLKFISEINFNPLPTTFGFNTQLERIFNTTTWRFVDDPDLSRNTFYNKRFTWERNYNLGWDFTKSLKFDYTANAKSIIDEPQEIQPDGKRVSDQVRSDSIWKSIKKFGRPKSFTQNVGLTYTLPFKFFPLMDWITVKASYQGSYTWTAQSLKLQYMDANPVAPEPLRNLGNTIQNKNTRQINGEFNFETLYNHSKYLAAINKPAPKGKGGKGKDKDKNAPSSPGDPSDPGGGKDDPGAPGGRDAGGRDDMSRDARDRNADDPTRPPSPDDPRRSPLPGMPGGKPGKPGDVAASKADAAKAKAEEAKAKAAGGKGAKGKAKDEGPSQFMRLALRPLMTLRKARLTYSETYGSVIPGYLPEAKLFGQDNSFANPGWPYVLGFQPDDKFLDDLGANKQFSQRPELSQEATRSFTQNLDAGVTLEPFKDFRIEVSAQRQFTRNESQLFKDQNFNTTSIDAVDFQHRAQRDMGSFTTSFFSLNTLFDDNLDAMFAKFQDSRTVISKRLGVNAGNTSNHPVDSSYNYGYGKIQQQVLVPAFLAAYEGKDPNTYRLDVFKTLPAPNWKLTYNGLSKLKPFKKIFQSIQISHGYKNTLTVNSYSTNLFYNADSATTKIDQLNSNYIARYEIPQIQINEQLSPLIGIDLKLKNDMSFKVDFKKSRTLAMSFIDYQLAESRSTGYSVGFGYRMKNVNIPFLTGKKAKKSAKGKKPKVDPNAPGGKPAPDPKGGNNSNDMNFKFDFDYKDDVTLNHRLDQAKEAVPTRGTTSITISPSVDYSLNKSLKLRLFVDYRKTIPKTSQSFPITNINAGVTVQFTLQ